MSKRRMSFRLDNEEALVVAPLEFWEQLHEHCRESAKEFPELSDGWLEAADHIHEWVERTRYKKTSNA